MMNTVPSESVPGLERHPTQEASSTVGRFSTRHSEAAISCTTALSPSSGVESPVGTALGTAAVIGTATGIDVAMREAVGSEAIGALVFSVPHAGAETTRRSAMTPMPGLRTLTIFRPQDVAAAVSKIADTTSADSSDVLLSSLPVGNVRPPPQDAGVYTAGPPLARNNRCSTAADWGTGGRPGTGGTTGVPAGRQVRGRRGRSRP